MEVIKHKQSEKQKQKQETQQKKQTKQQQNVTKQQNKQGKPKQNKEKPNLPNIQLYLTKNNRSIEARAAAFDVDDKKLDVTTQPSKDVTSASSRTNNKLDGIEAELQTKLGDAAKGLQL